MNEIVRSRIVQLRDGYGICIPRLMFDQAGISDEVDIHCENGRLIITAVKKKTHGEPRLLEETLFSNWEDDGWG